MVPMLFNTLRSTQVFQLMTPVGLVPNMRQLKNRANGGLGVVNLDELMLYIVQDKLPGTLLGPWRTTHILQGNQSRLSYSIRDYLLLSIFIFFAVLGFWHHTDPVTYTGNLGQPLIVPCISPPKSVPKATFSWSLIESKYDKNPRSLELSGNITTDEYGTSRGPLY